MAFTEFYCQSGGSNLNSGSDTSNTAKYTSTNGNWSTVTDVFTPTDGTNPVTAGVAVGDFASIYIDGATVGVFIGLITAVTNAVNGPITISTTSRAGTAPVTSTTTRTIKVGGACKGPNAGQGYPISLNGLGSLKDASGHTPRFNLKNDATYSITTGITVVGTVLWIQGYSTTPGDKGRAIIDGGTSLITPLALGTSNVAADLIVQNNGSSGSANGINVGQQNAIIRCVVHNVRGAGFNVTNTFSTLIECEAYSCNQSNTVGSGGFVASSETTFINCISHDNTGSNNDGFTTVTNASAVTFIRCISDSNGRHGFSILIGISGFTFFNCDSYNNGTDGIRFTNATSNISNATFRNCNFIKNGGYGLNTSLTTANMWGVMDNCGFGSGTMANVSGTLNNIDSLFESNRVTYATDINPYEDAPNGDFNIVLGAAIASGRGVFTTTQGGYGPTVGFEDIGAAEADATPFGGWAGTAQMPDGYVTVPYAFEQDYTVPLSASIIGTLPPGLALTLPSSTSVRVSGVPTTLGTYTFIIHYTRSGNFNDVSFTIHILPAPVTTGGTSSEGGEGEAVTQTVKETSIRVRDAEVSHLIRRARTALNAIENMSLVGEGVSGDINSGFMIN